MEESKSQIAVDRLANGPLVVRLLPKQILDELQISQIGQEITDLIESGSPHLILDFSNVDHLSSSALGMLITLKRHIDEAQGSLKLCHIRSQIFKVFRITKLDEVLPIYKTIPEALADGAAKE